MAATAAKKTVKQPKTVEKKQVKKSKLVLFWEKMPEDNFEHIDMRAILK